MIRLSYSACQRYLASPMSYFLHYLLRLRPIEEGSALVFGGALDVGLNTLLEDKKANRPIDVDGAIRAFNEEFNKSDVSNIKFSKADFDLSLFSEEEITLDIATPAMALKRKGIILIQEYAEQVIPKIQEVYEIQRVIEMQNELGDTFTGVIDIIAKINDQIWIVDNKSTSIKYAANSVSESGQLATYLEAVKDEYDLAGGCYITIPKKIRKVKKPQIQIDFIFGNIGENLIAQTFQDYETVLDGIKNARFQCSGKCRETPWGCAYQNYCQSGGKDLKGLSLKKESR